jgi:hypothetical protein
MTKNIQNVFIKARYRELVNGKLLKKNLSLSLRKKRNSLGVICVKTEKYEETRQLPIIADDQSSLSFSSETSEKQAGINTKKS